MKNPRLGALMCAFFFASTISLFAQIAGNEGVENYDIRSERTPTAQETLARLLPTLTLERRADLLEVRKAMAEAEKDLARRVPGLDIKHHGNLGGPEIVGTGGPYFLTPPSSEAPELILRNFLNENADLFGLTTAQMAALEKTTDYANPAGNLAWVDLQQEISGIPLFRGMLRASFTNGRELVRTVGELGVGLDYAMLPTSPGISAADAVAKASASIGVTLDPGSLQLKSSSPDGHLLIFHPGPFVADIKAELNYFPAKLGAALLAWSVTLQQQVPAYLILVDAEHGELLFRKNLTNFQTQPATYGVYDGDSPGPLSPSNVLPGSGIQGPGIGRTSFTFISELPAFDNLGWIPDGLNLTSGNNVDAGLDIDGIDGIDPGGHAVGSPFRVFDFSYNPPPLGSDPPTGSSFQSGAVTNLFFWVNRYHDRLYTIGFTEPAGNFQNNNFGRGGLGADAVSARAQKVQKNASFSTHADGTPGECRMGVFTDPNPARDTDVDQEILLHELSHGLSGRLHFDAKGLNGQAAGAMGEGWSDFYARALLSSASEDPDAIYAPSAYSVLGFVTFNGDMLGADNYYYGIRRFPYAVKTNVGSNGKPHNPLTLADIDEDQIDLSDGAFPESPALWSKGGASEVHNAGEVWCMALLEVRSRLIKRLGFDAGNQRMLQLVTDAMKIDPPSPSFVEGRDSLLAIDCASFAAEDEADIWAGFATRGMGFSATMVVPPDSVKQPYEVSEAFDLPNISVANVTVSDTGSDCQNGFADPGEAVLLAIPLNNPFCKTDATDVTAMIVGGGSASYGTITGRGTVSKNISFVVPPDAACGTELIITVNIESSFGPVSRTFLLRVGKPVVVLAENFDSTVPPLLPAGWTSSSSDTHLPWTTSSALSDTPPNAASANALGAGVSFLVSPPIAITTANAQLIFRHSFDTVPNDSATLEISIDGAPFEDIIDAGGSFVAGAYNGNSDWELNSHGFITTIVNLPASAAGKTVSLRWRFGTITASEWFVDTVSIVDGYTCCCILTCPDDMTVPNDPGQCGAIVNYPAPTSGACGAISCSPPSGSFFPKGTTTVACTSSQGPQCTFNVIVKDTEGPAITGTSASPSKLSPPNHKMVDVTVNYGASDNCSAPGAVICTLAVSSNEPINGLGDGDVAPDWIVVDSHHVRLRAERSGKGNGRIYTITITCKDTDGNESKTSMTVIVAK
jgi:extracellular elastinolytic metalloproteinase